MVSATTSPSEPAPAPAPVSGAGGGWWLAAVAAAVWAAAWVVVAHGSSGVLSGAGLLASGAVLAVLGHTLLPLFRLGTRPARIVIALAVVAGAAGLSCVATAVHVEHRRTPVVTELADKQTTVRAVLRPTSDPRAVTSGAWDSGDRYVVDATLVGVTWRGRSWSPDTAVLVTGGSEWSDVRLDATYLVSGVLTPTRDDAEPQAAVLSVRSRPTLVGRPRLPWRAAELVRSRLREAAADLPGSAPGLLPSLAVGDTSGLSDQLAADMRVAGLSHLTVVSGANVTLVCGGLVALIAWFGGGPRRQAVAGAVALAALVVVARPEPSVLRAAVMGAVGLVGLLLGRPSRALGAVSAACIVLLFVDPWLSRSYGFALSAAATTGIVVLARPIASRLPGRLPRVVGYPLAVTVAAQLTVTPILVLLDPTVALYAVPANLLAGPVVAPTMVLTTLAAVVAIASPLVAGWLLWPAAAGAAWLALLSHAVAGLPGASLPWWSGTRGMAAAAGLALGVVALVRLHDRLPDRRGHVAWSARRWLVVTVPVLVVAGLSGAGAVALPGASSWPPADWAVVVCDVGQGEAVLIRAGPGAAVVVDTGPDPDAMSRCLAGAGVVDVPLLVLTHFHADHVGGLAAVLDRAHVQQVWHSPQLSPDDSARDVAAMLAHAGVTARPAATGDTIAAGPLSLQVLWPDQVLDPAGAQDGDGTAINDASIVMRFDMPGLSVLCLGDVEYAAQTRLLAPGRDALLDVDVTTIAHHGSGVQVPELYTAATAWAAIASAAADNDYGHPDPVTTAMVAATGAVVWSTATSGAVALSVDPAGGVRIRTRR